jgi:hypothetical protein
MESVLSDKHQNMYDRAVSEVERALWLLVMEAQIEKMNREDITGMLTAVLMNLFIDITDAAGFEPKDVIEVVQMALLARERGESDGPH